MNTKVVFNLDILNLPEVQERMCGKGHDLSRSTLLSGIHGMYRCRKI